MNPPDLTRYTESVARLAETIRRLGEVIEEERAAWAAKVAAREAGSGK